MGVKGFMGTFLSERRYRVNPRCKVDSSILKINSSEIRLVLFFCFFPCKKVNFQAVNEDFVSLHNYIIVREIGETAHVVVFFIH